MNRAASLFLFVFLVMQASTSAQSAKSEDKKLNAFFDAYLAEDLKRHPVRATFQGDHRYDDRMDDLSEAAQKEDLAFVKKTLASLPKQVKKEKLSADARIDFEIFEHSLKTDIWLMENFAPFRDDPLSYIAYLGDSVYQPLAQSTVPKEVAFDQVVRRMTHIPRVVDQAIENLGDTKARPAPVWVEQAIRRTQATIGFYKSGVAELVGEKPTQRKDFIDARDKVIAALNKFQSFLEKDLTKRATGSFRIGKARFAKKLELVLDSGLTFEDVVKEAEAEFQRVVRDMYVISRQLWAEAYPKKPLPPDDPKGRNDTIRAVLAHYGRDHDKPENLVKNARAGVAAIKDFIAKNDILRLPQPDELEIIEMPEFQRGYAVAYLNSAPPLDTEAKSFYAISPPPKDWDVKRVMSYMEEYNTYMLQILTIHEAYPGHYVQLEYANRHPSRIRRLLGSGVFAEGWAVYTEQMMLDQGYGKANLPLRLHQLKFYLRAVANALLDYRMHTTDLSDADATKFLMEEVFQSEGEAVGKVLRSKQGSTQLSTYFVGRTAFYRLRQKLERELGDKFSLGRFHEAVLDHGSIPVKYLPTVVPERLKKPR
jgi:uncharacterized protein (DUF885 family)